MHKSVTTTRVLRAAKAQMYGTDNPGFCHACGKKADGCEPDARNYHCEYCGRASVFGAEETLLMM